MASIYGILDHDGDLRYIGKANDVPARMSRHILDTRRRSTPCSNWIAKHGIPAFIVLESDCEDWQQSEREWIEAARLAGVPLLNLADGGDQPLCSRAQRQANAASTNAKMAADPRARRIREIKRALGTHARQHGLNGRQWAKMAVLGCKSPKTFGPWVDKLFADCARPLSEEEYAEYKREVERLCA